MSLLANLIGKPFRHRWLASILLILVLDLATYLAFSVPASPEVVDHQDKILHAVAFFSLFILGHISLNYDFFPRLIRFSLPLSLCNWLIWVSYGLFLELVQSFLSYRQGSVEDMLANLAGMLAAQLFVVVFKIYPGGKPEAHE